MLRPFILTLAAVTCLIPGIAFAGTRTITAFDGKDSLTWQTVNDGVMGGRSRGGTSTTPDGTLLFRGTISLENNGGFSSIRSRPRDLDLGDYDGLEIRVRGDGRTYKLALRTSGTSSWVAYWADFETRDGEWTTVRIPFSQWVPTTFGRKLKGLPLVPAAINSIGFMLYDKNSGPFSLEVDSITAYGKGASGRSDVTTIIATARSAGTFKTLLAAAEAAGLVEALSAAGPMTVFAPSDAAFARLPDGTVESLLEPANREKLRAVLLHHVIEGDVNLAALLRAPWLTTLAGQRVEILREGPRLRIGGASIDIAGLRCTNGVIHVVDRVILPELRDIATIAVEARTFTSLVAAAKAAGLIDALTGDSPLTVFAPSDAAFARLPEGAVERLLEPSNREALKRVLLHHVVKGRVYADDAAAAGTATTLAGTSLRFGYAGGLQVAGKRIMMPDMAARNGVIHIVDDVLLPPSPETSRLGAAKLALGVIERAIDIGVGLFNGGNAAACSKVYEQAATELLALDASLFSAKVRKELRSAIDSTESAIDKAWTLRRALDAAYAEAGRAN